jgi:hypothetical protein
MESLSDLINAAQAILDAGFDVQAFISWKGLAFVSLLSILGPMNYYTIKFCRSTAEADPKSLLTAYGILSAAKEQISRRTCDSSSKADSEASESGTNFVPWVSRPKKWWPMSLLCL